MRRAVRELAGKIAGASVRHPLGVLAVTLLVGGLLAWQATRLTSEVGYAAYFGPEHPSIERLRSFYEEFDLGLRALVAFRCGERSRCEQVTDEAALELLARLQAEIDALPNVRRTQSALNAPILVGPLETRTLARRDREGRYRLADGRRRRELVERLDAQPFLVNTVVSPDLRAAGIVVELQSLESVPVRRAVHGLQKVARKYEEELGDELYLAGDPVWTVISDDNLDADSQRLTALMFLVILTILWILFRSLRLTLLPLLAVGILTVAVHGAIALLGFPMTSIMAALPPLLVVIAITTAIHLLAAYLRRGDEDPREGIVRAAEEVGEGCFWATLTTAGGFASFLWSDLESFRHFGGVAALGMGLSFALTFALLPALLVLSRLPRPGAHAGGRTALLDAGLRAANRSVARRPRAVLATGLALLLLLTAGFPRLRYETNFGDQSFILRSVHFMEEHFRKPMTTELVVRLPEGARVYDEASLRLLRRLEEHLRGEPSTGRVWSFLDFLEEAYRVDHGRPPPSFDALVGSARRAMPLVAAREQVASFWNESYGDGSGGPRPARTRVSASRAWLDDAAQFPYLERLRSFVGELNRELGPEGFEVSIEGGLVLSDLALTRIRATQLSSFASAFAVVSAILALLLRRSPVLLGWGMAANVLPVLALLGFMGWVGIGIDPANTMVAAILLAIAVDDTLHVTLRYRRERIGGAAPELAVAQTVESVGRALVITSLCLALGFSTLMLSRWGGLVSFGMLASGGVLLALAADLLLLPAALLRGSRRRHEEEKA